MRKLTKRISLAAASTAVAGGAVLGAGGTASAATPVGAHVQHSVVSVKADDHRRHHGATYRRHHKEDYCWYGYRARQHRDWDCITDWARYDRHGHFYRWDEDRGWKHDRHSRDDWEPIRPRLGLRPVRQAPPAPRAQPGTSSERR